MVRGTDRSEDTLDAVIALVTHFAIFTVMIGVTGLVYWAFADNIAFLGNPSYWESVSAALIVYSTFTLGKFAWTGNELTK